MYCDKILKNDSVNTMQLTQNVYRPVALCSTVVKSIFYVNNGTHCYDPMKCKALCEQAFIHTLTKRNKYVINTSTIGVTF